MLTFHHLFGNGPSYWVFFEEFVRALRRENTPALRSDVRTGDATRRLRPMARRRNPPARRAEDERFWLAQFEGGAPTLELPSDRPRPSLRTHKGGRVAVTLPTQLAAALRKVAAARRGSLFMVLLSAFGTLLHRLNGQDDLTVGVAYEGEARSLPGGERLFANTTNVLPLRSRAGERTTFAELFAANKDLVLDGERAPELFLRSVAQKTRRATRPEPVADVLGVLQL